MKKRKVVRKSKAYRDALRQIRGKPSGYVDVEGVIHCYLPPGHPDNDKMLRSLERIASHVRMYGMASYMRSRGGDGTEGAILEVVGEE